VPDAVFDNLKFFVAETEADSVMSFFLQKGRECIRVKNYVGLLETVDGTQLEILPKALTAEEGRRTLLRMLQHFRDFPFRSVESVHQTTSQLPLWEVFITAFLDEVTPLITQGLRKAYVPVAANQPYVKGKLRMADQIRQNAHHAERFAVTYADQTANLPQNRLLKSALHWVQPRSRSTPNQSRIRQLLFALDEVPASERIADDLRAVWTANRLFSRYERALRWAEALLQGLAFGLAPGSFLSLALLFPMGRVFEAYVAAGFRRYVTEGEVAVQESSRHLVEDHRGAQKFKLRPDIILRQAGETTVIDTKWKVLDATNDSGTYGIEQPDLYQLYAYGKKYNASRLVLVYPATETFREPLPLFGYDETMQLWVVPFAISQPLNEEVQKIVRIQ